MLPISVALTTVAPPAFVSIFGSQLAAASPLIRILAVYAFARALGSAAVSFLAAAGRPRFMLSTQLLNFAVTVLALLPALHHGATAIAASFAMGQVSAALYSLFAGRRFLDGQFLARVRARIVAAGAALLAPLPTLILVTGAAGGWSSLGLYAAAYIGILLLMDAWVRASCRPFVSALARAVAR